MNKLEFNGSAQPTLGVEIELALVDAQTLALSSAIENVLGDVPARFEESIKPELMQCYLEINSAVCQNIGEARSDLREKILAVQKVTDAQNLRLLWSGSHPFSLWREQELHHSERYEMLLELLQDMARQLVTFGLHVHVGVDSGDKAVMICDRIMQHLPILLALSANSPCWDNRITGLRSNRSKIMDHLPTAGLPAQMRNWSEYTWLVNHLISTGFIHTIREIWWDARPHHNFGTVEIRICDVPQNLDETLAIAALVQCLVSALSDEIDEGTYQHDYHPMLVRQNKWRACRYGLDAELVDFYTYETRPVRDLVRGLVERLRPKAKDLGCEDDLLKNLQTLETGGGAARQLALLEETGDAVETTRRLVEASRLTQ